MKYEDLDKTQDLFDIVAHDVPSPIENLEMEGISKNNITEEVLMENLDDEPVVENKKKKKKKDKKSLKEKWSNLSKKKKVIIIVSGVLVLAIIIVVLVLVLTKEEEKPKKEEKPAVVVEKDNYIYNDGVLTFLDEEENELGTYECNNKSDTLCFVANYNLEDNFDGPKNIYEDESKVSIRSKIYKDNYVFIYDNEEETDGVVLLYNIKDKQEEGVYTSFKGFVESDYVILKDENSKYGTIEFNDEGMVEKLEFDYDYIGALSKDSKLVVKKSDKYYIYSKDGTAESKGLNYEIKGYNNKYITVSDEDYLVYDYKGKQVFKEAYDYVRLLDDYAVLIEDNKVYVKDYKGNKYNEEGKSIQTDNYDEVNIYNDKNELIETKEGMSVEIVDNNLEIIYYNKNDKEKDISIDLYEGSVSLNVPYLSYFDGKLYFYEDEEKTEMLGNYTCTNKNTFNKNTKDFSNCLIASDTVFTEGVKVDGEITGWIPIFNEKYVFILDTVDLNNPTVVLYDLEEKKALSKYETVDTGNYTKENKISFTVVDEAYIMAENKSKKYGVIKLGKEVTKLIDFDYASISKLKDYYMAKESSGTYLLINSTGDIISAKYGYKIVDYKSTYLTVVDGNKYYVYDFNGKELKENTGGYLHVTLNDDYYVVVDTAGKLDIYKYNNADFKLSSKIDVGTTNLEGAYEVSKVNSKYVIKISSTGKTYNASVDSGLIDGDKEPVVSTEPEE